MSDLLCFHAHDNIYGISLEYVKESFSNQKVAKVPRLNHIFSGLCNHNGVIYPVISFSSLLNGIDNNHTCMLLLHVGKYQFILQIDDIPFIAYEIDFKTIVPYDGGSNIIKIDKICQLENNHVYVLNMKMILEKLLENILE